MNLRSIILHALIITIAVTAVYANTFGTPFRYDSTDSITENPSIRDLSYFLDKEKQPKESKNIFKTRYVGFLTLALNYRVHGLDVRGYHAVNLLIHVLTSLALYALVLLTMRTPLMERSVLRSRAPSVAFLAALLFALHPVQTQAVTYVIQRLASLTTMFYALSLLGYSGARLSTGTAKRAGYAALCLLCIPLAMKTKEIAFTLPLAIMLYEFMFFRTGMKKRIFLIVAAGVFLLVIPLSLLGTGRSLTQIIQALSRMSSTHGELSVPVYILTEVRVLVTYLRLLVLPLNQNLLYDYPVYRSFFTPQVLLSFVLLASVFGSGVYMLVRSRRGEPALRMVAFGIFFFFLGLSVESTLVPLHPIYEHRLYLPAIGVMMGAAAGIVLLGERLRGRWSAQAGAAAVVAVLVLLGASAFTRNALWSDPVAFWQDTVSKSPGNSDAHTSLGNAIRQFEPDRSSEAVSSFQRALELDPDDFLAHYNLAKTYEELGRTDKAMEHLQISMKVRPENVNPYFAIATIHEQAGNYEKALETLLTVLDIAPNYAQVYYNLGNVYQGMKDYEKAIDHYRKTIELAPWHVDALNNMGYAYYQSGRAEEAIRLYLQVIRKAPGYPRAYFNLGQALYSTGDYNNAIKTLSTFLSMQPRSPYAYYLIGSCYRYKGDQNLAIKNLRTAIELDPSFLEAHAELGDVYNTTGMYREAAGEFTLILRSAPDHFDANLGAGSAYLSMGVYNKALHYLKKAIELSPDEPSSYRLLGMAYRGLGDTARAEIQFRKSQKLQERSSSENTVQK